METVFIINEAAGNGKRTEKIKQAARENGGVVYITKAVGDATKFVKDYCAQNGGARFIACGGDGTLAEVVNGAMGCDGAEIGVIPLGTGNDFCRNFQADFLNVGGQIKGRTEKCDIIKYTTIVNGKEKVGYCVNMLNIGFDCNVADMKGTMQKYPFVSGPLAYFLSIFVVLVKKKGAELTIEIDGEKVYDGPLLLTSIANGCFCGGGIKSNPLADVTDGLINTNIIYNIKRRNFVNLLPHYMKGTHMGVKGIDKFLSNYKGKKIKITPKGGTMKVSSDGEIFEAGETLLEIMPLEIDFVIPTEVAYERTNNTK